MNSVRELGAKPSLAPLIWLCWLLASLATAALSHAALDAIDDFGLSNAYESHEHAAFAPVVVAAFALVASLLLGTIVRNLGRRQALDPAVVIARRFERMAPWLPSAATFAGGLATLLCMEFSEQFGEAGRSGDVSEALGGNSALGLAVVLTIALCLTILALRSARAVVATALAAATAIRALAVAIAHVPIERAILAGSANEPAGYVPNQFLARCLGLRAPPFPTA